MANKLAEAGPVAGAPAWLPERVATASGAASAAPVRPTRADVIGCPAHADTLAAAAPVQNGPDRNAVVSSNPVLYCLNCK